jgi:glycosyltransferase involved in cell wall biosynthesis
MERLAAWLVNEFDLVVVRGRQAEAFVRERTWRPLVAIVPGSVAVDIGHTSNDGCADAAGERPIDLIFVGRLSDYKQPRQFVQIVAAIAKTHPGIRAAVVGEGEERGALEELTEELGLSRRIEFAGRQADVSAWLRRSKLFVLTSKCEGLSIAMCEAMACGVVPVVANVGELSGVVEHGRNGFLIPAGALDAYVSTCLRLLDDAAERERLALAAREAALAHAGLPAVAERWNEVLCSALCDETESVSQDKGAADELGVDPREAVSRRAAGRVTPALVTTNEIGSRDE